MTINFPTSLDSNENLYLVHDALRVRLIEDYNPADTSITIEADDIFDKFPPSGIITLTEQCSEPELKAISLEYTSKGVDTFEGLSLLDGFTDCIKSKNITNVTLNVVSQHHNQLKDALISIETFAGIKDEISSVPLLGSMEARINYLRSKVLVPKAWFTVNKKIGINPLCIDFIDFSTREPDIWEWTFGDGDTQTILRTDDILTGNVTKCYTVPGIYSVTLKVTNDYGEDTITITDMINVRQEAPDEAMINFIPTAQQVYSDGILRSKISQFITISVDDNGEQPLDTIIRYVWDLQDDLEHEEISNTKALFSIGGIYDIKLKTETLLGAYRTTIYEDVIDIVEKVNIWHFIFDSAAVSGATTKTLYAYEFGLLSETYKSANVSSALSITRDADFLDGVLSYDEQYSEFKRNNGFCPKALTASGDKGNSVVFWAENENTFRVREFNAFNNTWSVPSADGLVKQWNWLGLTSENYIYVLFGAPTGVFTGSPTDQTFTSIKLSNYLTTNFTTNYLNGAEELMDNLGSSGDFSAYRGTWKDSNGYFARNDGNGEFFRIKNFYRTEGTTSIPVQSIRKLTNMPGTAKLEGQFVTLSKGLYFFNNTNEFLFYDTTANTWSVGGVSLSDFSSLQDKEVEDYDDESNTLIAVSDQSSRAYLFFDYSTKASFSFNEISGVFSSLPVRPSGEQFNAGLY